MTVLLLAGTGEAQRIARALADRDCPAIASLAGATRAPNPTGLPTHIGGFGGADGFRAFLKDKGITVHERHILPEEMADFEQCWLTGTAAEVTPVGQIGDYTFEVGALTREIAEDYEKLVRS